MFRLASLIVAGAAILTAFAVYADPPANPGDDPPVLLKKKGAPEIDDPNPPPPPEKDKDKDADKKPADAPKPDADKAGEPEQPQVDADEVLNRVAKNMRRIEERLANKEVGDGTRQAEDDVLKDLDSLIDFSENPPQSKDDKNDSSKSSDSSSSKSDSSKSSSDSSKSSSDSSKSSSGASKSGMSKSGSSSSSDSSSSKSGQGRGKGARKSKGSGAKRGSNGSQPGSGNTPSGDKSQGDQPAQDAAHAGDKSNQGDNQGHKNPPPQMAKDPNADLYKDVWGHLPETLRAEMNAYSNTKGFMPEYEALIRKYYSNIAEQGRRKGD